MKTIHLVALLLFCTSPLAAATLTVTNLNDSGSGSLRQACIDAASGDTVVFQPGLAGVVTFAAGPINLGATALTITGNADAQGAPAITLNGNQAAPLLNTGAALSLNTLVLYQGYAIGSLGGAIYCDGGSITCTDCVFLENYAYFRGGAIYCNLGNVSCSGCTFDTNIVGLNGGDGGAISCVEGNVTCTGCAFDGNSLVSAGNGGAISQRASGYTLTCTGCTFSNNIAYTDYVVTGFGNGGAIYDDGASITCTGCTFYLNFAQGQGGAIWAQTDSVSCTDCTFSTNLGIVRCIYTGSAQVTITNSIVADQYTSGWMFFSGGGATFTSGGYNICTASAVDVPWMNATGDQVSTDPMLGPLQDNGGPVPTMRPLAGSPALDKGGGSTTTTDARGVARVYDNPNIANAGGGDGRDIGAVEYVFNLDPAITAPANVSFVNTAGNPPDFGSTISIADGDATQVEVTLAVTDGTATLSQTTGLTFTTGDGDDDADMVFTGSLANVNAALDGMEYWPLGASNGSLTLEIDVNDHGASFDEPDKTDSKSVNIAVTAPVLDVRHGGSGYDSGETLNVGNVSVGGDATLLLRLRNLGDATLNITTPLGLSAQLNCSASATTPGATYDPGEDDKATITITPATAGAFSVLLTINSNDPAAPFTLILSGTALDPQALQVARGLLIFADGATDDLGTLTVGVKSKFVYTLTNTGDVTLALDGPTSIVSTTNCKIGIAAGVETSLAPGAAKDITVFVKPTAEGMFTAAISIATNDAASPFNLTLQGGSLLHESTTGNSDDSSGCAAGDGSGVFAWFVLLAFAAMRQARKKRRA